LNGAQAREDDMPVEQKTLTDADVMTGFNPAYGVSAEEIAAGEGDAPVEGATDDQPEGTEKPETETPPAEVEIKLDGKTLKAPRDIAEAFTREINRRDGTRGAELQQLRERLARVEGATAATATPIEKKEEAQAGPPLPNPELQIENPAEYQKQMLEHIEHKQKVQLEAVARQYEEAEAIKARESERKAAWEQHCDAFYSKPENKVLRENRDIVDLVLAQNKDVLAPLSVEDGFAELARLAKERLARVTGTAPEQRARAQKPLNLEGSTRRASAVSPEGKDSGPTSLTSALKERRRLAAEAFNKGSSGRPAAR
jgi:hypothetical protein